ncbi:MAG: PAS domain S-box protein [Chloroflexi bacterium]|nr:PAS domain S-box protein [Chloroflexota bacterium]
MKKKAQEQPVDELIRMGQQVAGLETSLTARESEDRFRAISELVSDFVYAIRVEPDGTMVYEWTTEALTNVTGYTVDELEKRGGMASLVHPDDRRGSLRRLRTLRSDHSSTIDELRIVTKSGEMRWIRNYARSVWDEDQDRVVRIYGAVQDITERKQAEAALREQTRALQESEERLRLFVESVEDIVTMQDVKGKYLYYGSSPRYGIKSSDVIGRTPSDFHEPAFAAKIMERLQQVVSSGQSLTTETELVWQGETLWFIDHLYPIKDMDGHISAVATILHNITERKRAEEGQRRALDEALQATRALQENKERLDHFMHSATDQFSLYDSDLNFLDINQAALKMFLDGTKKEDIIGKNLTEIVPDFKKSGRHEKYLHVIKTGEPFFADSIVPHPFFGDKHLSVRAFKVGDGLGLVVRDVTERVQMVNALRESEVRYRTLFEQSLHGIMIAQDGRIVLVNSTFAEMMGYSVGELIAMSPQEITELVHPEDKELVLQRHWDRLAGKDVSSSCSIRYIRKDGAVRWMEISADLIEHLGKPAVHAFYTDITERKQTEQALHQRTAQLEALREVELKIAAQLDLDTLLHSIASWAMEMMQGISASVCLYVPEQDALETVIVIGEPIALIGSMLRRGESISGRVWETGKPVVVDDYQHWVGKMAVYDGFSIGAMISVPIRLNRTFLGALSIVSDTPHAFTQADAELLSLFATQAAIAIRNARLYEARRKQATQLAVVNQVARQVVSILEPDQLLHEIVTAIQHGFGYFNVILLQLDEATNELGNQAMAGGFSSMAPPDYRQKVGEGLMGWVAETGRSLLVNDVRQSPQYIVGFPTDESTLSELCVPLKLADHIVGVLDVQAIELNAFDETDLVAMETLAGQIAVAIKNAQLYERAQQELAERKQAEETLQRRNRSLALLNRAGQEFAATLDLDQVLAAFLGEVCHLLDVTAGSVWLIDFDTDEVVCQQAYGPENSFVQGWRLPLGRGITGWVARHGQSLVLSDAQVDDRYYRGVEREMEVEFHSILSVPLRTRQKVIGTLQVVDTMYGRFDAADLTLIESLAATAAIAIENARLYEQTRRDAETKATLLHEINHRVKNNLSAIIGLIYAEQRHARTENQADYQSILRDLSHRVQGLAKVHTLLSASGWASLPLDELVGQIIWVALQMLPRHKRISVDVTPSSIQVIPEQANDLALVINELATNTAVHALTEQDQGGINVRIAQDEDEIVLIEFRDDGPGYPEKVLTLESHSVGLYLIQSLVSHNLCGELTLCNDGGAVTTIRFKKATDHSQSMGRQI